MFSQSPLAVTVKTLLPNLILMRLSLERIRDAEEDQALIYAQRLVDALLRQKGNKGRFEKRFSNMFADQDLLMATALRPTMASAPLTSWPLT